MNQTAKPDTTMQNPQSTNSVIMCRPTCFAFNEQTGLDNEFQHHVDQSAAEVRQKAMQEFETASNTLANAHIEVNILEHADDKKVPDAVFPNNWFTTQADGTVTLFPMKTPNRQQEVDPESLDQLLKHRYTINSVIDLRHALNGHILEGTGALVFDHVNRIAYAALSERCENEAFKQFCQQFAWQPFSFIANSQHNIPFYHTNVMMSMGTEFAVVCMESLSADTQTALRESLEKHHQTLIDISLEQTESSFCGNILELRSTRGDPLIAMSDNARNGFTSSQLKQLEQYGEIVSCPIPTIEFVGGGSLRCMLAENFLPSS